MSTRAYIGMLFIAVCVGTASIVQMPGPDFNREVYAETKPLLPKAASSPASSVGAVDLQRSRAYVFVGKTGLGHDHGAEGRIRSGTIRLGAAKDAGSIVFDMASFTADTPAAREYVGLQGEVSDSTREKVNENMLGPHVLDVGAHPTATFNIRSALPAKGRRPDGTVQYQLDGDFTLRGVTRPLRVNAESETKTGVVRLRGLFTIRQTQFGIKPFSRALGAVGVADELKIWGDVWLAPEPAEAN